MTQMLVGPDFLDDCVLVNKILEYPLIFPPCMCQCCNEDICNLD